MVFKNIVKNIHDRGLSTITFFYTEPFQGKYFYIQCNLMNMVPHNSS